MLLFAITSSHAIESEINIKPLPADQGLSDEQRTETGSERVSLRIFPGTNNSDVLIERDTRKLSSSVAEPGGMLRSYISYQSHPQSIVNDITIDFSTRKNVRPFNMDFPSSMNEALLIGSAFMTNLMMHEFGHTIVADQVGASGNRVNFFKEKDGSFFLGTSTVSHIESGSRLPYVMGGEFFADITFEQALREYRKSPSVYNRSLLLFSGTDFLFYCIYAFSTDSDNPSYDPVTISMETGISQGALLSVALAKTMLNAYRVHSGEDRVVPYFTVDEHSAALNLGIPF